MSMEEFLGGEIGSCDIACCEGKEGQCWELGACVSVGRGNRNCRRARQYQDLQMGGGVVRGQVYCVLNGLGGELV